MNTLKALLLVATLLVPAVVGAGENPFATDPDHWALAFENDTPKPLVLDDPAGRLTYYWYMVYRVSNPNDRAVPCKLDVTLLLELKDQQWTFEDVADRVAEQHLEKRAVQRPLLNGLEIRQKPIEPDETREGVAIFRIGKKAKDFDHMTVQVRGLAKERIVKGQGEPETGRVFRQRVLNIQYQYVPSRWAAGKELKVDDEVWTLENVEVSNQEPQDDQPEKSAAERLEELRKKAEELRKRMPPEDVKGPPASSSKRRAPPGLPAGPRSGQTAAKILQALCQVADKTRTARVAFVETIGPRGERRQRAEGTLYLGKDGRFAAERILNAGTPQAIKELRIFDGKTLWAQTTTKEFGDSVRRCDCATIREECCCVDGRPEVDFATVANPVQAWRLFGSDLVHLGVERLEREGAYVFEVRPSEAFEPVLTGPLSCEALYKAAGRRVRFWIGARSGFQLRMRVYGDDGQVVAALECETVELEAHVPAKLFAYSPPPGVKVTDVNAAVADNGTVDRQPSN
ncbi:MAG: LolA family protein [Planctomycetota bacterium]